AVTPSQLAEAVERIGDRAHPRASALAERRREEQEREAARADAERHQLVLLVASAALTAPLLLPMIAAPFGLHLHLNPWIELALATPVQFVIGARFYPGKDTRHINCFDLELNVGGWCSSIQDGTGRL
ncbi:MAG: hypothetical protein ND807_10640, partial [Vicinamibacterales bacterium]|nr:hypothetical protein [Vicinamibacterales bacterium]